MSAIDVRRMVAAVAAVGFVAGACGGADGPELGAVAPTVTPTAAPTATATPHVPPATPTSTPTIEPEPTPTVAADVAPLTRGVTGDTVRIGVIKTGTVFGDVETGVAARVRRTNADGGVGGRQIELGPVIDDGGDPAVALQAARQLIDQDEVFAIVLATAVPEPELTDLLAAEQVPFFGWGFAPGFCAPNEWGFGFNGCLLGSALGIQDARPDVSARELTAAALGRPASVVLVVTRDSAGEARRIQAEQVWGEQLLDVVVVEGGDPGNDRRAVAEAIEATAPNVVLLAVGLDLTLELKPGLVDAFDGLVVDTVAYLPGLLGDFALADRLEGGYSISQFPPQEEYREVTAVVATDLEAVGGGLIYSQAVSLGYWSTDLLVALLEAVGPQLDTATFFHTVNRRGVMYEPALAGAPCPIDTLDIHHSPAGGAALVQVRGGIYRPVIDFGCY